MLPAMEIQPIVIGTAGHIDHGKSTLVRALTGIDPDRLKEEKERGMTIDLGFAPLELPDGRLVGIVDVPGHERFVRNMVAGATGIDLVVLVVAADDGVMPQTREHLQIMQILGVERGVVALTKVDMVDSDLADLAEEDVRETLEGTFLEDAPIFRVSAISGEGFEEFKTSLFALAAETEPRSAEGIFRMPVQRVFSKTGFGTVVTGIPVSGTVGVGDVLEILPGNIKGKVRGLNAYRNKTDRIRSGHSAAINFSDVNRDQVQRGSIVATPNFFSPQRMLAARITALPGLDRSITNRMQVRLHTGTGDPPGEVVLLDKEEIAPGETGLVQLRLSDPVVCAPGDRFVLRLLSPVITLGGGVILDESRHRLKRFKGFVLQELERQEESLSSPQRLVESLLIRRGQKLTATDELQVELKRERSEVRELLAGLVEEGAAFNPKQDRWIHSDPFLEARRKARAAIDAWFEEHPHRVLIDVLELRQRTSFDPAFLEVVLEQEREVGAIERESGGWIRPLGREPKLSTALAAASEAIDKHLAQARFQPPSTEDLRGALEISEVRLRQALEHLADRRRAVRVAGDLFLSGDAIAEARQAIIENCQEHGQLEIPQLRDRLGSTRKFLIPVLEFFDADGLTIRQGGHRILRRT
ncbi:MAG: selenocysteine-specific elongation factor [Planctomycetota bacterium]|jgi:selenocysteine-specific elongation factor